MQTYITKGTCSRKINYEVVDNTITHVEFEDGCDGSLQAISKLVIGMNVDEAIQKMEGINCGSNATSCPDQFAKALKEK